MTTGVVLAAGRGSRLQAVAGRPKALNTIEGHTLLCHTLSRFAGASVGVVYLVIRTNEEEYRRYSGPFQQYTGAKLEIVSLSPGSFVDSPLNDIIDLGRVVGLSPQETLLVSYCDVVTTFKLVHLTELHRSRGSEMTVLLFSGDEDTYVHKYRLGPAGRVTVEESPRPGQGLLANGGIFMLDYDFLSGYDVTRAVQFSLNNGPAMKASNRGTLFGCSSGSHYFREVGTPKHFRECCTDVRTNEGLRGELFPLIL